MTIYTSTSTNKIASGARASEAQAKPGQVQVQAKLVQAKLAKKLVPRKLPSSLSAPSAPSALSASASFGSIIPLPCEWNDLPAQTKAGYKADLLRIEHMVSSVPNPRYKHGVSALCDAELELDIDQLYAVAFFLTEKSFVITGPAGSGKTLLEQALCLAWLNIAQAQASPVEAQAKLAQAELAKYTYKLPVAKRGGSGTRVVAPAIYVGAFTNKAAGVLAGKILCNPRLALAGFGPNLGTLHALCEFAPVEMWSEEKQRSVRRFMPQRTADEPLVGLRTIIIDETSQVGVGADNDLGACQIWTYLYDAMDEDTQVVLVGDINQLPPVGGKSVLSYGLVQLPVIQLTHFHRQAAESPIIAGAHRLLSGKAPKAWRNLETGDELAIRTWPSEACLRYAKTASLVHGEYVTRGIRVWLDRGEYVPGRDMFLVPIYKEDNRHLIGKYEKHNKAALKADRKQFYPQEYVSARTINRVIATELARREGKEVWTVYAGGSGKGNTHYISLGDRVMVNRIEGVVTDIEINPDFRGKLPQEAQVGMDYWGHWSPRRKQSQAELAQAKPSGACQAKLASEAEDFTDAMAGTQDASGARRSLGACGLDAALAEIIRLTSDEPNDTPSEAEEAKVRAASHKVTCRLDNDAIVTLSSAGDFGDANFKLAYALTVHSAQGSEWDNVFILFHPSHTTGMCRELFYTAMTRARRKCILLGDAGMYERAVESPRICGDSLAQKIEFFNGGSYLQPIDISKLRTSAPI